MTNDNTEFEDACLTLYRSYGMLNRICWQGRLPACRLVLSRRLSSNTLAYAQDGDDETGDPARIVFNAEACRKMDDTGILELMAHEMTHIYQFSQGRRAGHRRDFQDELRRLGLIRGEVIPSSSPFGYVLFMHELRRCHPAAAVSLLAGMRVGRARYSEFFEKHTDPCLNHKNTRKEEEEEKCCPEP